MDVFVNDSIFVVRELSVLRCFFSSKSHLPKHIEIFSAGTYLKVGIMEQSYDFFS